MPAKVKRPFMTEPAIPKPPKVEIKSSTVEALLKVTVWLLP